MNFILSTVILAGLCCYFWRKTGVDALIKVLLLTACVLNVAALLKGWPLEGFYLANALLFGAGCVVWSEEGINIVAKITFGAMACWGIALFLGVAA